MQNMIDKEFKVLDKGFIRVIDFMGNDSAIVQAARVSYGKGTKTVNEDKGLINYLVKHHHTSPLEMCEIKLHLKMPIFVARQWIRHRTASLNEYSARYSEIKEEFYVPEKSRLVKQSKTNKQCSGNEELDEESASNFINMSNDHNEYFLEYYKSFNEKGLSREINRINAPVSNYTEFYWKIDLHNLLHFLKLRTHSHAQYEIKVYADILLDIVKQWCPLTHEAFMEHVINAKTFSRSQMEVLRRHLTKEILQQEETNLSKREFNELLEAFDKKDIEN